MDGAQTGRRILRVPQSPRTGVFAMIVTLLAVSAVLWRLGLTGEGGVILSPRLPWWLLAPLFALVEVVVLHVQVRREAQAVSLSEVPLVLAVFLAEPGPMLLAAVVGAGAVYVGYRHQTPVKAVFNTTLRVFGVSASLSVFHLLAGPDAATAAGPRGWAAAIAGVSLAGAADGLLVLAVVGLHEGTVERHEVVTALARYPLISAVVACVGVLITMDLHGDPRTAPLVLLVGAMVMVAYRAHASLNDRHVSLAQLYDFGRAVTGAHVADEILASALRGARSLLKAEAAEVVLLGDEPGQLPRRWVLAPGSSAVRSDEVVDGTDPALWHRVLLSGKPTLVTHSNNGDDVEHGTQLSSIGYREAIVVALRDESRVLGTLMVAERMGEVRPFHVDDVATLETIANQAGLALAKGRLLDRMQHEALHDVLTGLANRTKFRDAVQRCLRDLDDKRDQHDFGTSTLAAFAVMLIDLDGFKEVNDSLGHHHGDALLMRVAQALVEATPAEATVARLGGDEFAVLLPQTRDAQDASAVADRIHVLLGTPVLIEDIEVKVRASVGIALAPAHGDDVSSLLRAADSAMYRAKIQQTATSVHTHGTAGPPASEPATHTPLALLAELRKAVDSGDIDIYVQPQADARTGDVHGVEALVRWCHPQLGVLPPSDFLTLAERHGLMRDMTALVLDRAVRAAQTWQAAGLDLSISVNLPARALADERTLAMVDDVLTGSGLMPARLTLEITEDSVIADPEAAIALLNRLRERGVRLSVDDFGTGYSSLSYLRRLPVDEVKIDRSFVAHLTHDTHDLLIARSIIDLGTNLALDVVVEGVEDQQTWDHLATLGAHTIQGYHLARPMPVSDLLPWLHGYNTSRRSGPKVGVPAQVRRGSGDRGRKASAARQQQLPATESGIPDRARSSDPVRHGL